MIEVLIWKKPTDSDLSVGLKVSYKDTYGAHSKLGTITDTYKDFGITHYIIDTSFGAYLADELRLIREVDKYPPLNIVEVKFEDSSYNYVTNVSSQSTEESSRAYFVGKYFNLGAYPIEDMQKCIDITFKLGKHD